MKQQILLFLTFLLIYGCSSSSDSNNNTTSVTDADGNVYQTVTICDQIWTQSNLNVSKYRNGDVIPQVQDGTQWAQLTTGAWCYYNNDSANGPIYGKLYNWYAVNDSRGLAPLGYHIPSDTEWTTLTTCLGGESVAGNKMKSTTGWTTYSGITNTNSSGFTGLPGGIRWSYGTFENIGSDGFWWSSSEGLQSAALGSILYYNFGDATVYGSNKKDGFSVRCVKD